MNKNPLGELLGIFNKLGLQQKIVLAGVAFATVILFGIIIIFLNEPNYTVLYNNVDEAEASKIVEELTAQKIPYQLENDGRTIKVTADQVQEVRLSLAAKGIPNSGIIGYEIFDQTTIGMSEFMQKLNYKRALEGELSRTIMQQDGVEAVRVHIVAPKKSLFKEEQDPTTASVVLKLKGSTQLSSTNVNAIVNLVASSIEGLEKNKITVIDTHGRLLSQESEDDPLVATSSKQYQLKQQIENYLSKKAQNILDNVLGHGNSIVQVDAELNFDQVDKTIQSFDPESQVAISEQTIKSENGGTTMADSSAALSQNSTINYEISKTIERVIEGSGNVKQLSVATVVNDEVREVEKAGAVEIISEPRTQEQMQKLQQIVENAVGVKKERNDQISLVNIPFETNSYDELGLEGAEGAESFSMENMDQYFNYGLIIFAIASALFILKGLMSKLKNEKILIGSVKPSMMNDDLYGDLAYSPSMEQMPKRALEPSVSLSAKKKALMPVGDLEDEISDEAARRRQRQDKISNYVAKNPMDAAKLINTWLHEDEF